MEKSDIESYLKAGEISKEVKNFARNLIKPGMKLIDIAEKIDAKILELGGEFAFPVNLSIDEIAAHFTPEPGDKAVAEGILKIDVGVAVDGFIADTAFSIDLTDDGKYKDMMELNEEILTEATKRIKVGMEIRDIGEACQDTLDEYDDDRFAIIKTLSGHSLDQNRIHAGLTISNYRNENRTALDNIAFAIEPFVTTGVGDIYEGEPGGIYVLQSEGNVRDRDARKVLAFIKENYKTRPFCLRWLVREAEGDGLLVMGSGLTVNKLRFTLSMFVKQGVLHHYPMLIEKSKMPVSQFENTFVVADGKVVCTTG